MPVATGAYNALMGLLTPLLGNEGGQPLTIVAPDKCIPILVFQLPIHILLHSRQQQK